MYKYDFYKTIKILSFICKHLIIRKYTEPVIQLTRYISNKPYRFALICEKFYNYLLCFDFGQNFLFKNV